MRFCDNTKVMVKSRAGLYDLLVFLVLSGPYVDSCDINFVDIFGTIGATI